MYLVRMIGTVGALPGGAATLGRPYTPNTVLTGYGLRIRANNNRKAGPAYWSPPFAVV